MAYAFPYTTFQDCSACLCLLNWHWCSPCAPLWHAVSLISKRIVTENFSFNGTDLFVLSLSHLYKLRPRFSSVQSLSHVQLFATPWIAARQASLSITSSQSLPKLMFIESVMPSSHLILCCPLLLLPSILSSIRVFSNESTLRMRWPKYWSFSFNISPFNEHPGLISLRMDWLDLLAVQGTLKSLLQHHSSKVQKDPGTNQLKKKDVSWQSSFTVSRKFLLFLIKKKFLAMPYGLQDLSHPPGITPMSMLVEVEIPSHWTTRKFPENLLLNHFNFSPLSEITIRFCMSCYGNWVEWQGNETEGEKWLTNRSASQFSLP